MKYIRLWFVAALVAGMTYEPVDPDRDEKEWEASWEREVKDIIPLPVFVPMPEQDLSYTLLDQHTGTWGEAFLKDTRIMIISGSEK